MENSKTSTEYNPDYISPPAATIRDCLKMRDMTEEELGLDLDNLVITEEVAQKLYSVFKISAQFWLSRESHYRNYLKSK